MTPQVPLYIPVEVCATVGALPGMPPDECMNLVRIDVGDDGVSAAKGADIAGLRQVVADAKQQGIDLKVVVVPQNPLIEAPLRDIATDVGHAYPGSTVLVISPNFAGVYSTKYDRVILEAGQDAAKSAGGAGNPVQSARDFVTQLNTPDFPWMTLTIVLVVLVALATVLTRVLQVRSRRAADPSALRASGSSESSALRASGSSGSSALRASGSSEPGAPDEPADLTPQP